MDETRTLSKSAEEKRDELLAVAVMAELGRDIDERTIKGIASEIFCDPDYALMAADYESVLMLEIGGKTIAHVCAFASEDAALKIIEEHPKLRGVLSKNLSPVAFYAAGHPKLRPLIAKIARLNPELRSPNAYGEGIDTVRFNTDEANGPIKRP